MKNGIGSQLKSKKTCCILFFSILWDNHCCMVWCRILWAHWLGLYYSSFFFLISQIVPRVFSPLKMKHHEMQSVWCGVWCAHRLEWSHFLLICQMAQRMNFGPCFFPNSIRSFVLFAIHTNVIKIWKHGKEKRATNLWSFDYSRWA